LEPVSLPVCTIGLQYRQIFLPVYRNSPFCATCDLSGPPFSGIIPGALRRSVCPGGSWQMVKSPPSGMKGPGSPRSEVRSQNSPFLHFRDCRSTSEPIACWKASISDHFGSRIALDLHNRTAILANLPAGVPEFALLCNLMPFRTPVFRDHPGGSPTERVSRRIMSYIHCLIDPVIRIPDHPGLK